MFNKNELDELLTRVGIEISKPIKIYMIGGCALSFKDLKPATKDIDIIVTSRDDFDIFDSSMKKNGFKSMSDKESEFYATALAVYMKEESRIDVFLKEVGKMLVLSYGMTQRAEKYKEYGKLGVYLVSNEDIFLFKLMTSREGDTYDCDRLMKEGLDYDVVYNEIIGQSKEEGKRWFFWVYESLCKLENHNSIKTPLKNKVFALVKKHWKEKPSGFMEDVANKEQHIPDKKLLNSLNYKI